MTVQCSGHGIEQSTPLYVEGYISSLTVMELGGQLLHTYGEGFIDDGNGHGVGWSTPPIC